MVGFTDFVADRARGTAMLFNDRFGLQRLYYHEAKDTFYFAAEAKAILKVRPELRVTDPRGLGEFIVCGCVLENRTLFPGIHVLPPGSAWTFRGGMLEEKSAYFEPSEWEEEEPLKPEDYYAHLRDVFVQNLPRYFQWQGARGRFAHGWTRHAHHHGLAQGCAKFLALLHVWQHVSG